MPKKPSAEAKRLRWGVEPTLAFAQPIFCAAIGCMKRWALITGASQDIGLEFAKLFAANGWNMALIARDKPRLEKIAGELRASYGTK
jgi:hypothetical protein